MGLYDWVAAGASLLLFIALFIPWVIAHDQGRSTMSGADYGWLAVISVIAIFTFLTLRVLRVNLGISSALVYLYFGGFAVLMTAIMMAIRPFSASNGAYITGTMTRYPFVGACIAIIASLTILVCGILQREGMGLPPDSTIEPEFPGEKAADFIAGSSALLLFISLFIPWVSATTIGYTSLYGASFGWVGIIGVILVALGLLIKFLPVDSPVPTFVLYIVAGGIALLMTVLMMALRPMPVVSSGGGRLGSDVVASLITYVTYGTRQSIAPYFGAYMGLISSLGILLGGYMKYLEQ